MKAVVAAFNQEKALEGAFSVITNLRMELFEALPAREPRLAHYTLKIYFPVNKVELIIELLHREHSCLMFIFSVQAVKRSHIIFISTSTVFSSTDLESITDLLKYLVSTRGIYPEKGIDMLKVVTYLDI